jgi:hypothetical protein
MQLLTGMGIAGAWAVTAGITPTVGGANEIAGCNSRWSYGYQHKNCAIRQVKNAAIWHNCDAVGGSSGSPILYKNPSSGAWSAIGLTSSVGSSNDNFYLAGQNTGPFPQCTNYDRTKTGSTNWGASVDRFRDAPRFATDLAIQKRPDNPLTTQVFAIDADRKTITYRARKGSSLNTGFDFWKNLGAPPGNSTLARITACEQVSQRPQIFVVTAGLVSDTIYTNSVNSSFQWGGWQVFSPPSGVTKIRDVEATPDNGGFCSVFIAADTGAYWRTKQGDDKTWNDWSQIATGNYKAITGVYDNYVMHAAMIDSTGNMSRTNFVRYWVPTIPMTRPGGVAGWTDLDITLDEAGRAFMVAIPTTQSNALYFTPLYGDTPWASWYYFDTHLWAPDAGSPQPAPKFTSLTASRWKEDTASAGQSSPIIFATDDSGNIYFIEYAQYPTPRWVLNWKSFYHDSIKY